MRLFFKRLLIKYHYKDLRFASKIGNIICIYYSGTSTLYRYKNGKFMNVFFGTGISKEKEKLLNDILPILQDGWILRNGKWIKL